jgi:hypothetical protein
LTVTICWTIPASKTGQIYLPDNIDEILPGVEFTLFQPHIQQEENICMVERRK